MKMNVPNTLTIVRIFMVPVFVVLILNGLDIPALVVFVLASLTDTLDGYLARKNNQVTVFGKFMDPLADKLLVCSALICLIDVNRIASWIVIVIVAREFIISGFRLVAAEKGQVIAASYWGKFKTVFQMIATILLILNIPQIDILTQITVYISLGLTIISLIDYLKKNISVLQEVH